MGKKEKKIILANLCYVSSYDFRGGTQIPRSGPTELMFMCGTVICTKALIAFSV